jgi:hypothetical protein
VTVGTVYLIDLWPILLQSGLPVRHPPPGPSEHLYHALDSYIDNKRGPHTGRTCAEGSSVLKGHYAVTAAHVVRRQLRGPQ